MLVMKIEMKVRNLFIEILNLLVFISILIYNPVFTKDNPQLFSYDEEEKSQYLGDWFSKFQKTPRGVYVSQIRLKKHKEFDMYRLSLHPEMKWEEARYRGTWKLVEGELELQTLHCSVYTSTEPGERRALLRSFDCDHLTMKALPLDSGYRKIRLSPNQYGSGHSTEFHRPAGRDQGKWAVVLANGQTNIAWGIDLKYFKKGQRATLYSGSSLYRKGMASSVVIRNVVETSLEFQNSPSFSAEIGDYLFLSR